MAKAAKRVLQRQREEAQAIQRKAVVDEYGALQAKLAPFKPDIARLADLAKSIRSWGAFADPGKHLVFSGDKYACILGQCGIQSRIKDMGEVYAALGHEEFIALCEMTLKALDMGGADVAALTVKEQTGPRSITVTPTLAAMAGT